MELAGARQLEAELKSQLATAAAEAQKSAQGWATVKQSHEGEARSLTAGEQSAGVMTTTTLRCQLSGLHCSGSGCHDNKCRDFGFRSLIPIPEVLSQVGDLEGSLKEERMATKKYRGQVQQLEEELSEARGEKEAAEKV